MARLTVSRARMKARVSLRDVAVTLVLWVYFILAFAAGYWLIFLLAMLFGPSPRFGAQWAVHHYARGLFGLLSLLSRVTLRVPELAALRALRSHIVVSNHLSFLDPMLLLSIFPRASTVVRPDLFQVPVFGTILRSSGFLPGGRGTVDSGWLGATSQQLAAGGTAFLFPEGKRSHDGRLSPFRPGAFYLARRLGAPLAVVALRGTGKLFPAGSAWFRVTERPQVELRWLATLSPQEIAAFRTARELARHVRALLEAPTGH
jgi:1-acyl-sn-glycerol-3-phosphate acyltransferase